MAHHSDDPFPDAKAVFDKMLHESATFRGALGTFPEGKLTPQDEGAIQFQIGVKDGKVVLDFGTPVAWLGLNAQQAASLANLLIASARKAARQTGEVITISIGG